ncbi:hypothetical protein HMPREF1557_00565 [Streptococcus sobrinus W1703]|uniref:Uncharacterized protein n=1 Tax=Streptococcus sobrinus W1703 TaxID=1227275 RepID=U2KSC8_9STRE|nr:hypothetical protein HMPREF1557_00565 [Streptococcus sobrinus W1703]
MHPIAFIMPKGEAIVWARNLEYTASLKNTLAFGRGRFLD